MNALVFIGTGAMEPFTTSDIIAKYTKHNYRSVQRIIENQIKRLETFGQVRFEITPVKYNRGTNMKKVYHLNEQQSTLLTTFLKNTDVVADFKVELVRQFFQMRQRLWERQSPDWRQARVEGKKARRLETDAIKKFVAYAAANGSHNADAYYVHFTKLANEVAGIESKGRNTSTTAQLLDLRVVEQLIDRAIGVELAAGTEYHMAYRNVRDRVKQAATLIFVLPVLRPSLSRAQGG